MSTLPNSPDPKKGPEVVVSEVFPGLEPETEHVVSGPGAYCMHPVLDKKHRLRPCYLVLRNCIFELHKSIKDVELCRPATHCIDLRLVFNVCMVKEMLSVKDDCIAVMTPTETYYIEVDPKHFNKKEFCEALVERCRKSRSEYLGRPVYHDEYFEAAWDVKAVSRPNVKKRGITHSEDIPDLVDVHPQIAGPRRLCVRPASLVVFKVNACPSNDIDKPYEKEDFFDFPISIIATFGNHGNYFFMQMGRCSDYGTGELWLECENQKAVKFMHERIDFICKREADRRREAGISLSHPGSGQHAVKSRLHRDRARTRQKQEHTTSNEDAENAELNLELEKKEVEKKLRDEAEARKRAKEEAERRQTQKQNKGFMSAIRRTVGAVKNEPSTSNDKGRKGGLFGFGTEKKKQPAPEPKEPIAAVPGPSIDDSKYDNQDDYMPYDHQVDPKKAELEFAALEQNKSPDASDTNNCAQLPYDYAPMEIVPERSPIIIPQNACPLVEAEAYINDGTNHPVVINKGELRKLTGEYQGLSLEARTFSLGSKPRFSGRNGSVLSSTLSHQLRHQKTAGDSTNSSPKTVKSIMEEDEFEKGVKSQLDDKPSTSSASATQLFNRDIQFSSAQSSKADPKSPTLAQLSVKKAKKAREGETEDAITDLVDVRIRAHSLGSRSWVKSAALRKLQCSKQYPESSSPDVTGSPKFESDRSRTGSTGSCYSHKKQYDELSTGYCYADEYGDEGEYDLMEIDFNKNKFDDSPVNRSRNASFGVRVPTEMMSALEEQRIQQIRLTVEKEKNRREREKHVRAGVMPETYGLPKNDPNRLKKKKYEEKDYIQIGPSSPATMRKLTQNTKRAIDERKNNPPQNNDDVSKRRHRNRCKKQQKREPSLESFSSISSDDPVVLRHDSNGSLEDLESGNGMSLTADKSMTNNLMAHGMMRPMSKSMGANTSNLSKHRSPRTCETENQRREKDEALRAHHETFERRRAEGSSRKQSPIVSHRHYSVGQQSARLLRSPSPKHFQTRTNPCSAPNCSLCQSGSGRPRTSFIDSAALLASPASSRKHSTVVTPPLRPRVDSNTQSQPKKSTAPRKTSSLLDSPKFTNVDDQTPQEIGYKPMRKNATGAPQMPVFDMAMLGDELSEYGGEKAQSYRRESSSSKKHSPHCRHRRSSLKQHQPIHKQPKNLRPRSIPAPIVQATIDYVEIVHTDKRQPSKKKTMRHGIFGSSSDEDDFVFD